MAAELERAWTDEERRLIVKTLGHMSTLIRILIEPGQPRAARIKYQNGLVIGHVSLLSKKFPQGLMATIPPEPEPTRPAEAVEPS